MNVVGVIVILTIAILAVADAYGAEMGSKAMAEWGIFGKVLMVMMKYPLAFISIACSCIGAMVVSAYQKKDRLKQFLVNASISIVTTPFFTAFSGMEPTPANWAATALALGVFSGIILKIIITPEVHEAFKNALIHQINERLGHKDDDKSTEQESQ